MNKVEAPWTGAQVDALNRYQRLAGTHEFTCGNDHGGDKMLVATRKGWICPHCDYVQSWAWDAMLSLGGHT